MWFKKKPHSIEHEEILQEIVDLLRRVLRVVERSQRPQSGRLRIIVKGETLMPLKVHVNDAPGNAVFAEFSGPNGTGSVVAPVGAVSYASDNHAVATVDPVSGVLAYVAPGVANISGSDAGNSLSASDALTVEPAVAVSATLTLNPGK